MKSPLFLAAALVGAMSAIGIQAVVVTKPRTAVVVPQTERTYINVARLPDGGNAVRYENKSCGRVLDPIDGGILREPCYQEVLNPAEQKCAEAYFTCVVAPRVRKASER